MDLTLNLCIGITDISKCAKAAQNTKCNRKRFINFFKTLDLSGP